MFEIIEMNKNVTPNDDMMWMANYDDCEVIIKSIEDGNWYQRYVEYGSAGSWRKLDVNDFVSYEWGMAETMEVTLEELYFDISDKVKVDGASGVWYRELG